MKLTIDESRIEMLEKYLHRMDIPSNRKRVNLNNLKWLHKNLATKNSENPNYESASALIEWCLENKNYTH